MPKDNPRKILYQQSQFRTGPDPDMIESMAYPPDGMEAARDVSSNYASHPRNQGEGGVQGPPGVTPHIQDGTWWFGEEDSGVSATGDKGDKGAKGDKGDPGPKGDPGDKGEQGPPGDKGDKGDPGEKGADGESVTITNSYPDDDGNTVIEFSDGSTVTVQKGDKGDPGEPAA